MSAASDIISGISKTCETYGIDTATVCAWRLESAEIAERQARSNLTRTENALAKARIRQEELTTVRAAEGARLRSRKRRGKTLTMTAAEWAGADVDFATWKLNFRLGYLARYAHALKDTQEACAIVLNEKAVA